ncbi:GGDEF domain-containing protein [Moritella sp. 24]|uniref:GGDEF domain-containing protein n=1 Tax=Moritella sp. 24 TaxID=2746230 RepID=UPI001BA9710B|nr:GGDEF domain-containing protein [Moritella sp. 24]QUM77427.1 GGDEF domain-containing protein [Moritella sp. 24]
MKTKYKITTFLALVFIVLVEIALISFITFEYKQSNKEAARNVESIRASYWASWYFGKELSRLDTQLREAIYLNISDIDRVQEKLDFLIVSYDFLASDKKISPLLQAYAVKTLQLNIDRLDKVALQILASDDPVKQYSIILDVVETLQRGHYQIVFFELKGGDLKMFTREIESHQQSLLYIIYGTFLIVTMLLIFWSMTYLNSKHTKAQSNLDALTLLPNRKRCVELIRLKIQKKEPLCCFFIDLNHFKQINDTLGHHAGDEVLKVIAKRVSYSISGNDVFARIGGDEFILILCHYGDRLNVDTIVERIMDQIQQPIHVGDNIVSVGSAIGISFLSDEIDTVDKLFSTADSAMYLAKASKDVNSSDYRYY